jgi:hypothetical protein
VVLEGCGLTLKIALFCLGVTRESCLRLLVLQLIQNLLVRDIADLEVLLDQLPILVADATLAFRHHSVASIVCSTDVAVDAAPALVALALFLAASW